MSAKLHLFNQPAAAATGRHGRRRYIRWGESRRSHRHQLHLKKQPANSEMCL